MFTRRRYCTILIFFLGFLFSAKAQRQDISLNDNWLTTIHESNIRAYDGFEKNTFSTQSWKSVQVPHNWDQYDGYRRLTHGNKHGYAWYRKSFTVNSSHKNKRYFLYFEGVGSYATIWLNGKLLGTHAGGRTTFQLDATNYILLNNQENILAVRADHPAEIQDLPWVCGGCSTERGFSEGSQPIGIFRPVHLLITEPIRIAPFGIHIWNDTTITTQKAQLYGSVEIQNLSTKKSSIKIVHELRNQDNLLIVSSNNIHSLSAKTTETIPISLPSVTNPKLWSPEQPHLYQMVTKIYENGKLLDIQQTSYGIRVITWLKRPNGQKQLLVNGKPFFINGIAEYEHLLGNSHAFSAEQIKTRVGMVKAAGFNAFRDAHQPHNLHYQDYWDRDGILWWPQMAAHIWYDSPAFRQNFKALLKDWVKERRNSPSIILWGLENESTLPEDFAKECTQIIRELDPTASSQRLVTTCNGGKGTDWDVPQNWTGTYGGDPAKYAEDLERQVLVGEYGAWRTVDLHQEKPVAGTFSEEAIGELMQLKLRLTEAAKQNSVGHFFWLLTSHDNPGRVQSGEALRELDRIGPVNYKGLLTPWEEPADIFYLFRATYTPAKTQPMVYIVSHTWPDRWTQTGIKSGIKVYSNCDEVELFNDLNVSLGKQKRGKESVFTWNNVAILYNVLIAKGYVNGKKVAEDIVQLHHLPTAPAWSAQKSLTKSIITYNPQKHYLYRVNCGGDSYTDRNKSSWLADQAKTPQNQWGYISWANDFEGIPKAYASQRRTFDPITNTTDDELFQSFRYGRDKLSYQFALPDGHYEVELYFIEPWHGTGGGYDYSGWRLFDVAFNGKTVLKNLDIWKEAGHDAVLKKTILFQVKGGKLNISFPQIASGQAIISAIAIASTEKKSIFSASSNTLISSAKTIKTWLDTGKPLFKDSQESYVGLPPVLYGAEYLFSEKSEKLYKLALNEIGDIYVGIDSTKALPKTLEAFENTQSYIQSTQKVYRVFKKRVQAKTEVELNFNTIDAEPLIFALPASTLQPPFDLKTTTTYKATEAKGIGEGIKKMAFLGKERMSIVKKGQNSIQWTISTGVADTYSLTIKYHNPTTETIYGKLSISLIDGTMIKSNERVALVPTKTGKWNYVSTTTGTMINAGKYHIVLELDDATELHLDALDIQ